MKLTPKQQRFVEEYIIDLNSTQASIRAGYSPKTAGWIGPQLLGKTHISDAIQAKLSERSARTDITADKVLKEIAIIGFINKDALAEWPCGKLADKMKALELLCKHLNLFSDTKNDEAMKRFNKFADMLSELRVID